MFDLAGGQSAPGTKVRIMLSIGVDFLVYVLALFQVHLFDTQLNPVTHRCRLWKPVLIQPIHHSVLLERAGEDDETSSTTTINAADVPEGGELVLVTTTTTRTVVTKVPKQWSEGPRA
jgi:hypothetical protein